MASPIVLATTNNYHLNETEIKQKTEEYNQEISRLGNTAKIHIQEMLKNILMLKNTDRLAIAWDSAGDLPSLFMIADEAITFGAQVHVIYYRSLFNDDASVASVYLGQLVDKGADVDIFDYINYSREVRVRSVALFAKNMPTVSITNLADAMDLRQDICRAQQEAKPESPDYDPELDLNLQCNGLELPAIDISGLNSGMFGENRQLMRTYGMKILNELKKYTKFHFLAPDGTDLYVDTGGAEFINEADNYFGFRPEDYKKEPGLLLTDPPIWDNPPGEIYSNIKTATGTLVMYQIDTDVMEYAFRHPELFPNLNITHSKSDIVFDEKDFIKLEFDQTGHAVLDKINGPGIRSVIFKKYLEEVTNIDEEASRSGDLRVQKAALLLSEIGLGINGKANNPEDKINGLEILSALITEKKRGIWHLAMGKHPNILPGFENRTINHIDNGLRNQNLNVSGIDQTGREILLSTNKADDKGVLDGIFEDWKIAEK